MLRALVSLKPALGIFFSVDTVEPFHEGQGARPNVLDAELRTNREWRHYGSPRRFRKTLGKQPYS